VGLGTHPFLVCLLIFCSDTFCLHFSSSDFLKTLALGSLATQRVAYRRSTKPLKTTRFKRLIQRDGDPPPRVFAWWQSLSTVHSTMRWSILMVASRWLPPHRSIKEDKVSFDSVGVVLASLDVPDSHLSSTRSHDKATCTDDIASLPGRSFLIGAPHTQKEQCWLDGMANGQPT